MSRFIFSKVFAGRLPVRALQLFLFFFLNQDIFDVSALSGIDTELFHFARNRYNCLFFLFFNLRRLAWLGLCKKKNDPFFLINIYI